MTEPIALGCADERKPFCWLKLAMPLVKLPGLPAKAMPQTASGNPAITLLNDLPTVLAVGESHTIQVQVTSGEPFLWAMALPDTFYSGRGIVFHDSDRASRATLAVLKAIRFCGGRSVRRETKHKANLG